MSANTFFAPKILQLLFVICFAALAGSNSPANAVNIYAGLTAQELVEFAKKEGWDAAITKGAPRNTVTVRTESKNTYVTLLDCNSQGRCMSGIIRLTAYYSVNPDDFAVWVSQWNMQSRGATGIVSSLTTLQRYLHFNGVTDAYLRDVIGRVWPKAARSFWAEVDRRQKAELNGCSR